MNDGYVAMWNAWSKRRAGLPVYDTWLDSYQVLLERNKEDCILDLGCGLGANTIYLKERGYSVLACDFAQDALDNIEKHIQKGITKCFDMRQIFPFEDSSFSVVIADLCLQYFDDFTTRFILREIKRVLKKNGVLLARVARVDDVHFGACEGEELEQHYYFEGGYTKRFFDEEDVEDYFAIVGKVEYKKTSMIRNEAEYQKEKRLFEIKVICEKEDRHVN